MPSGTSSLHDPNDNCNLAIDDVLPALIRKAHEARQRGDNESMAWGGGTPRRRFLCVDDLADACLRLMERGCGGALLKVSSREGVATNEWAETGMNVVGRKSRITSDTSQAQWHAAQAARGEPSSRPRAGVPANDWAQTPPARRRDSLAENEPSRCD